jgi:hypothetical protein
MTSEDDVAKKIAEYCKSFEIKVDVKNITSSRNIIPKQESPISISEFLEKGMVLYLPPLTCSQGHQLMLDIELHEANEKILAFNSTAKILSIESTDSDLIRVSVKFAQFDPFIWKKLQRIYSESQEKLQVLLGSLKGPKNG